MNRSNWDHAPPRDILRAVEQLYRQMPHPPVGGIARPLIARAIRELLHALEVDVTEPWHPLEKAVMADLSGDDAHVAALVRDTGESEDFIREQLREMAKADYWRNDIYQVAVRRFPAEVEGGLDIVHLSIKRTDQRPIHDWRHFQLIKNQLCGPEYEGVELYPAESRLADSANQYHLWVIDREDFQFPFGFTSRLVKSDSVSGAVQRPHEAAE